MLGQRLHAPSSHGHLAAVRQVDAADQIEQGRLAATAAPEQRYALPRRRAEIDALQDTAYAPTFSKRAPYTGQAYDRPLGMSAPFHG